MADRMPTLTTSTYHMPLGTGRLKLTIQAGVNHNVPLIEWESRVKPIALYATGKELGELITALTEARELIAAHGQDDD